MVVQQVFAANVRKYRDAADLTQEELAEKAGLHRTYIGQVEQGRANPTIKSIDRIADALDVDPAVLLLDGIEPPVVQEGASHASSENPAYVYALIRWDEEGVRADAIDVHERDLTIQVLLDLIARGFHGRKLVDGYRAAYREVLGFLRDIGKR